jgi:hypothetical protein
MKRKKYSEVEDEEKYGVARRKDKEGPRKRR